MSARRPALWAAALWWALALPSANAQDVEVTAATGGVVRIELEVADLLAAGRCPLCVEVAPLPGGDVAIAVARRPAERAYTLEVFTEATTVEGSWVLQAQFVAFAEADGRTWTSPWVNLTAAPAIALPAQEARRLGAVRVVPTYRLLASGHEPAGTHLVRVVYRVRESGSSAAHDLVVDVPAYLVIRAVDAVGAPTDALLSFDLSRDPGAYVDAVVSGRPLTPGGTAFERIEIATNAPRGYQVTVELLPIGGREIDHAPLRDRVTFRGQPAHGRSFRTTAPSSGSTVLIERADIALTLDGSEPAGAYRYLIMFRGVTNP